MEHEPEQPTGGSNESGGHPPPFQPDPDLIAYLEHGGKPSEAEVRQVADKIQARSRAHAD
jgi:hypothetical protein